MTWDELVEMEPRLKLLLRAVRRVRVGVTFCANAAWYDQGKLKERLTKLVGSGRLGTDGDPRLWSSDAYDLAYDTLYEALPDCAHRGTC